MPRVFVVESQLPSAGPPLVLDFFDFSAGERRLTLKPKGAGPPDNQKFQVTTTEDPVTNTARIHNIQIGEANGTMTRIIGPPLRVHLEAKDITPGNDRQFWYFHHVGPYTIIMFGKYKFKTPEGTFPATDPLFVVTAEEDASVPGQTHRILVKQQQSIFNQGQLWLFNEV